MLALPKRRGAGCRSGARSAHRHPAQPEPLPSCRLQAQGHRHCTQNATVPSSSSCCCHCPCAAASPGLASGPVSDLSTAEIADRTQSRTTESTSASPQRDGSMEVLPHSQGMTLMWTGMTEGVAKNLQQNKLLATVISWCQHKIIQSNLHPTLSLLHLHCLK